ncbi:MAG TPA: universal stress protein [Jatrophihabitans sp.]|nr:universal stress protein [Jatrophihabitans sp.]
MAHGFEIGRDGPSRILACVDGSPTSMRAAAWAAGMARRQRSQLVVTFVAADTAAALAPQYAVDVQQALDQLSEQLRAEVTASAAQFGIAIEFIAAHGDPYGEICRLAHRNRVDAVVVGASAQAGHRLVGSLAVRLVRAGKWPVTVVP